LIAQTRLATHGVIPPWIIGAYLRTPPDFMGASCPYLEIYTRMVAIKHPNSGVYLNSYVLREMSLEVFK
jgi:hypothetical protein